MVVPVETVYGREHFVDSFPLSAVLVKEISPETVIHKHDFLEVAYVSEGSAVHHVRRQQYEVFAGDIFVIDSSSAHYYSSVNGLVMRYLLVGRELLDKHMPTLSEVPGFSDFFCMEPIIREATSFEYHLHLDHELDMVIENLLKHIEAELAECRPGYKIVAESLLLELLVTIGRAYRGFLESHPRAAGVSFKNIAVDRILRFMEEHYQEQIKLADLARCGCLQEEYLCRVFKQVTGMTIIDYLIHFRVQKAETQLVHSMHSVSEISFLNGFNDVSYFIKTFRKITGLTPAAYRKAQSLS
jgi:AraC-like DNA-binding protein